MTWKTKGLEPTSRQRVIWAWSPNIERTLERWGDGQFPSHLPSWSPARGPLPNCPNTRYCLGIHVTLTKETAVVPPPSHAWTVPLVEGMLCFDRTGLTEAIITGPGRAVLFYRRCSLGEGLSPDESRDTIFVLTGVGTWVGKPAYLATGPLTIQEGWQEIAQAITKCQIKVRDPRCPHVNPLTPQPFWFDQQGDSPQRYIPRDANLVHKLLPWQPPRGQNHNRHRRDQGLPPPQPPLPSPDPGFWKQQEFSVNCLVDVITIIPIRRLPVLPER